MICCAPRSRTVCIVATMTFGMASALGSDVKSIEPAAHGACVAAINSNDVNILLADLTDDIVYQSPGEPGAEQESSRE
jgi:hypothetical protein